MTVKIYFLKTFALHLGIAAVYLGYTCFRFVVTNAPNPIGIGLQQWFFFTCHLVITLIITYTMKEKSDSNYAGIKYKWLIHFGAVTAILITYLIFCQPIWEWLWQLR